MKLLRAMAAALARSVGAGLTRAHALRLGWYAALALLLVILGSASHAYRNRGAGDEAAPEIVRAAIAVSSPAPSPTPQPTPAPLRYVWPVEGEVIGAYSPEALVWSAAMGQWQTHPGIDIAARPGEAVGACADGTVAGAWRDAMWGNVIEIEHPDGRRSTYAGVNTLNLVAVGEAVSAGQAISAVGQSAACESDLPWHLHFALAEGDVPLDFARVMAEIAD